MKIDEESHKILKTVEDRGSRLYAIKKSVDFREVDAIFDDIVDEQLESGTLLSMINGAMVCVICVSAYLWLQLNKVQY